MAAAPDCLSLFFDGGSRANPGHAGSGFVAVRNGKLVSAGFVYLGPAETNNVAEYNGLIMGLSTLAKLSPGGPIVAMGDSELVVKQLLGIYKVKAPHLKPLHAKASALLKRVDAKIVHIPRAANALADFMSNVAMDRREPATLLEGVQDLPATMESLVDCLAPSSSKGKRARRVEEAEA